MSSTFLQNRVLSAAIRGKRASGFPDHGDAVRSRAISAISQSVIPNALRLALQGGGTLRFSPEKTQRITTKNKK